MNDTLEQRLRVALSDHAENLPINPAIERLSKVAYHPASRRAHLINPARWQVFGVASAGLVAALIAALVLTLGGTSTAPDTASAAQVIARTAAFVTGTSDGVLHVYSTTTAAINGRRVSGTAGTVDRWSQEKRPFDYRVSSPAVQEVKVGNTLIAYRADWNQISVGNLRHGPEPVQVVDPLNIAIAEIDEVHGAGHVSTRAPVSPASFARTLAKIIKAPNVTVNQHASLHGAAAIAITSRNRAATLYADPGTYRPLELVAHAVGVGDRVSAHGYTSTTVFHTYETLPQSSLKLPDLVLEFPQARVAPWERKYWKQYWSRASSGSAQTRRQALADLGNK